MEENLLVAWFFFFTSSSPFLSDELRYPFLPLTRLVLVVGEKDTRTSATLPSTTFATAAPASPARKRGSSPRGRGTRRSRSRDRRRRRRNNNNNDDDDDGEEDEGDDDDHGEEKGTRSNNNYDDDDGGGSDEDRAFVGGRKRNLPRLGRSRAHTRESQDEGDDDY